MFGGDVVGSKYGIDTLAGTGVCAVVIVGDAQAFAYFLGYERSEVAGEVPPFGCGNDSPSAVAEVVANSVDNKFRNMGGEERYHIVVRLDVYECATFDGLVPHRDKIETGAVQDFHLFLKIAPCKFLFFPGLALVLLLKQIFL